MSAPPHPRSWLCCSLLRMPRSTWNYQLSQIITALQAYCDRTKRDPKTTYVWICFACINQHRALGEVPFDVFRAKFETQVAEAGRILSLLAPWKDPANLKRSWCLLEIVTALMLKDDGKCELEIIMPPDEEESFNKALVEQFDEIAKSVSSIDMASASARPEDEANIRRVVKERLGFHKVNTRVLEALREWLAEAGRGALQALPQQERGTSTLMNNLGMLLQDQGKLEEAEPLFREPLEARRETLGPRHPSTLASLNNLAMLLQDQGKLEEAEPLLREVAEGFRETLGPQHRNTLNSEGNLGMLMLLNKDGPRYEAGVSTVQGVLQQLKAPPHNLPEGHPWIKKFQGALE